MTNTVSRTWNKLRGSLGLSSQQPTHKDSITIVSGLPRSGTSMMMKMLEAGGLLPLTDRIRTADDDNPQGYYEFERVKQLDKGDTAWLPAAKGKTVKVIATLLKHLPPEYDYKVIFMGREMEEILKSQKQMLIRRGEPTDKVDDEELAALFQKHLSDVKAWMAEQPNIDVLYVNYNAVMEKPDDYAHTIDDFLGGILDVEKMVAVVDPKLYRQRQPR